MSTITITTAEQLWEHQPAGRCELVRGELRTLAAAGGNHGWVIANVTIPLGVFVKEHRLGYVFGAETGFIIHRSPDSVRAPDVAFVRRDRLDGKPPVTFFDGPPDLAVELLSPSDTASAVDEKAEDWLTSGCREVWIIDPQRETASRCTWSDGALVRKPVTMLASELLPGFKVAVASLFEI